MYRFIILNDVWILFLSALGVGWYFLRIMRQQQLLRRSAFYMERDQAGAERNRSIFYFLFFAAIIGFVSYINFTIDEQQFFPITPTPNLILPDPNVPQPIITAIAFPTDPPPLVPTATLRNNDDLIQDLTTPTPLPQLDVPLLIEGCDKIARLDLPVAGTTISQRVELFGQADNPAFSFYSLNIRGPHTEEAWEQLGQSSTVAVPNGYLGGADISTWENGIYQLQLTVFDSNNELLDSCLIQIGVNNGDTP